MTSSGSILPWIAISDLPPSLPGQPQVRELALRAGFTEAGIVALPYAETDRDAARFAQFVAEGRAGTMDYLTRLDAHGELVRGKVERPIPWARSAIVCLASYHSDHPLSIAAAPEDAGWIARYAWSSRRNERGEVRPSDYHKVLLKRLKSLEADLHKAFGDFESRAYVDTGPVVERALANAAGLGWTGKNTCLIHPKFGSWNFLAVLITSLPAEKESAPLTVPDRCGTCRRCLDACPTGALTEPYRMDATRCISYLTIEHRGEIGTRPDGLDMRAGIGRQVFGCDICQDVCPWNRKAPIGRDPELTPRSELVNPSLEWLADLEEADFERIFNGSPVRRTGFWRLRRNVAVAMGNSGMARFLPWLERWSVMAADPNASHAPPDAAGLTQAARWAVDRIAARIAAQGARDSEPAMAHCPDQTTGPAGESIGKHL